MSPDGFVQVLPDTVKTSRAACSLACTEMGHQKARRVTLTFRLDDLHEDVRSILTSGSKFDIAFNSEAMAVRIQAHASGRYETVLAPRSGGKVRVLRFPLPIGMLFRQTRVDIDPDSNIEQRSIIIDIPSEFHPSSAAVALLRPATSKTVPVARPQSTYSDGAARPFRVPVDVSPMLMGDPPPGRSALDARRR